LCPLHVPAPRGVRLRFSVPGVSPLFLATTFQKNNLIESLKSQKPKTNYLYPETEQMELTPLTKEQAEKITAFFKSLENKHTFQFQGVMDTLIVTHVTIAPFRGTAQDDFKYNFQTGFDLKNLVDKYTGAAFTVLVIANILSVDNITLTQPYFFDIWELNAKQVIGFSFPPELFSIK
jgi:hypothetical protein